MSKRISKIKLANKIAKRVKRETDPIIKSITSRNSRFHWVKEFVANRKDK